MCGVFIAKDKPNIFFSPRMQKNGGGSKMREMRGPPEALEMDLS